MTIEQYIQSISSRYNLGNATEHTFRGDLQQLLESMLPHIRATNEPKRQSCGAPDYILTNKDIPVGFIEAKDIGDKDLEGAKKTGNKEQFDRYKASLNNILFTDYLDFHLYIDGVFVTKIAIAEIHPDGKSGGTIVPLPQNFATFTNLIKDFASHIGQTIKSAKKLAEMMAGKARLLSDVIEKALTSDEELNENSTLQDQMNAFKQILIHDITPKGFADVYAQTIAYGMFAARLHDPTLPTFSRQEAAELIPKSNPFLRKLFGYIAGPDIDDRIKWIVDSLVDIFLACNVEQILKNYGKTTKMEDPIIHFYETFLSEYDPKLRKARGVWYTPQPVVNFIVRAVDDILKTEFDLPEGLADHSKTRIKIEQQGKKVEQDVHRVQILDPATGTGTFLAEVVKHIHQKFEGQQGIWSQYVESHLLPRLNGFELLMASYAMAHLQLDLLLTETGYTPPVSSSGVEKNQRLRIYLTNSLEESHPDTGTLFANWLSTEANEANHIKRDTPVMCVIGNPPYSGISSNNGEWISKLIEDYKYVDGVHFNERKHWLNDDYVKFLRYGQHFIEKNGSGVLAFINPHGFLDNPTFRGMRWHLLKTYDKIYTIDLHGNSKKKETAPDGSADINVFDIQQGVSINIFIKTGKKKTNELGKVFHFDLFGKREVKYDFLSSKSMNDISFQILKPEKPYLFFVPKNNKGQKDYENGFRVDSLFPKNVTGIVTMGDSFIIEENLNVLKKRLKSFIGNEMNEDFLNREFGLGKNYAEWISNNKSSIKLEDSKFTRISYRLFDDRYTYFDNKLLWRWRIDVMQHFLKGDNIGIDLCRQIVSESYSHIFVTNKIVDDSFVSNKSRERGYVYPLYLYPENTTQQTTEQFDDPAVNFNMDIVSNIEKSMHAYYRGGELNYPKEATVESNTFSAEDVLDYIYAVLHSPSYRIKYREFLKIDFPRVPYPKDLRVFFKLVDLGNQLRHLHLLESPKVNKYITQYPVGGDNKVVKPIFVANQLSDASIDHEIASQSLAMTGRVYINETQYFDKVPKVAWEFYIGGYQPAQKWLKDRKDRTLDMEDILHYQKIVVALTETNSLMQEIDKIEIE